MLTKANIQMLRNVEVRQLKKLIKVNIQSPTKMGCSPIRTVFIVEYQRIVKNAHDFVHDFA